MKFVLLFCYYSSFESKHSPHNFNQSFSLRITRWNKLLEKLIVAKITKKFP
jgi:hypothetical protein